MLVAAGLRPDVSALGHMSISEIRFLVSRAAPAAPESFVLPSASSSPSAAAAASGVVAGVVLDL